MGSFGTDLLPPRQHLARFGVFEFDLVQKKLFRDGRDVGLQQQPATLLAHLLRTPGSIITRDELRNTIWPSGTHVEFEYGLNTAVNRVRRALRDSASDPRYIETIPKQGYRFIAPVEVVLPATDQAIASSASEEQAAPTARKGEPEASRTTPFALRPFRIGGS